MSNPKHVASIMAIPITMSREYTCRAPRTASPLFTMTTTAMPSKPTRITVTEPLWANTPPLPNIDDIPFPTPAVKATSAEAATSLRYMRRAVELPFSLSPAGARTTSKGSGTFMVSSSAEISGNAPMKNRRACSGTPMPVK